MDARHTSKRLFVQLISLFVLFLVLSFIFGLIAHEVLGEKEDAIDKRTAVFINGNILDEGLTRVMKVVTFFGSSGFLFIGYVLLLLWLLISKKSRALVLNITAAGIAGFLTTLLLKELFKRIRPGDPLIDPLKNYSFPSGHASSGFIFYGLLAWLVWRSHLRPAFRYILAIMLLLFSLLIGFSRVYLRMHYASDVIAGFCLGLAWLIVSVWFLEKNRPKELRG